MTRRGVFGDAPVESIRDDIMGNIWNDATGRIRIDAMCIYYQGLKHGETEAVMGLTQSHAGMFFIYCAHFLPTSLLSITSRGVFSGGGAPRHYIALKKPISQV